jgi:hypothetical protein
MKKALALTFLSVIGAVMMFGITSSVAEAEPYWCIYACGPGKPGGCELIPTCTCVENPAHSVTCSEYCAGACDPI